MKRYAFFMMAMCLAGGVAHAQDVYESVELASGDLNGTARYVGMGGALGALGGDVTTMSVNPAGTALFRHNEISLSVGGLFTDEKGQLGHDASRMSFDQAGIVFVMDQGNRSNRGLQSVNFGVNYVKHRNHFGNIHVSNIGGLAAGNFSQTYQIANMANDARGGGWQSNDWPILAKIFAPDNTAMDNGAIVYDGVSDKFLGVTATQAAYRRATYGSNAQFDFNLSFNVSDQFFWGLSIGVYSQRYNQQSYYYEMGKDGNYYDMLNWYDSKSDGFDIKLGMICRPFEDSPFRVGLTVHTPIWYSMDDVNGWSLNYTEATNPANSYTESNDVEPFRYSYRTPWKLGVSVGHTFGKDLALGLEYELTDPSTARYLDKEWEHSPYFNYVNDKIKSALKAQHTLKLGAECKIVPDIALRVGYNYVSSPFKNDAFRLLHSWFDTYQTETAYINWKDTHRLTLGMGYRFKGGYFDIAYQYQTQKGDLYAFDGDYTDNGGVRHVLQPTSIKHNRSQILATLGLSF